MALALDGSAGFSTSTSTTVVSGTLTTTSTNDVIVAVIFLENVVGGVLPTISAVKLTSAGTAFANYTSLTIGTFDTLQIWWVARAATLSDSVTATVANVDAPSIVVFGVSGANTTTPWDTAAGAPYHNTASTNVAPSVSGVSTATASAMLLGFSGIDDSTGGGTVTETAGSMAGTTGTLILSDSPGSGANTAVEYRILSSTISSQSVAFGTATGAAIPWGIISAAIVAASTGDTLGNPMQLLNV